MNEKVAKVVARHIRSQARENSADFNPDIRALFALEGVLLPLTRAQRNLTRAFTLFVQMKTPKVTPDGMIGGRGFVMPLKDAKDIVSVTIENLSRVIDAIDDEISNNPVWQQLKKKRKEEPEPEPEPEPELLSEEPYLTFEKMQEMEETGEAPEMTQEEMADEAKRILQNDFEEEQF